MNHLFRIDAPAHLYDTRITRALLESVEFDPHGFMIDPNQWSREIAQAIAMHDGIGPLLPVHWQLIEFLRDRYLRIGAIPPMRNICRATGLKRDEVKAFFGSCYQAWRLAGLPDPGEDIRSYMK